MMTIRTKTMKAVQLTGFDVVASLPLLSSGPELSAAGGGGRRSGRGAVEYLSC